MYVRPGWQNVMSCGVNLCPLKGKSTLNLLSQCSRVHILKTAHFYAFSTKFLSIFSKKSNIWKLTGSAASPQTLSGLRLRALLRHPNIVVTNFLDFCHWLYIKIQQRIARGQLSNCVLLNWAASRLKILIAINRAIKILTSLIRD